MFKEMAAWRFDAARPYSSPLFSAEKEKKEHFNLKLIAVSQRFPTYFSQFKQKINVCVMVAFQSRDPVFESWQSLHI